MKTYDEQELDDILKHNKRDIAVMLVNVQRMNFDTEKSLRNEIYILRAELKGLNRSLALLDKMAGESDLGMHVQVRR